jgi:hypothetical protein
LLPRTVVRVRALLPFANVRTLAAMLHCLVWDVGLVVVLGDVS